MVKNCSNRLAGKSNTVNTLMWAHGSFRLRHDVLGKHKKLFKQLLGANQVKSRPIRWIARQIKVTVTVNYTTPKMAIMFKLYDASSVRLFGSDAPPLQTGYQFIRAYREPHGILLGEMYNLMGRA